MNKGRSVRGIAKPADNDPGGAPVKVVITSGESVIAEQGVASDGAFRVEVPEAPNLVITIFALDGRAVRRQVKDIAGRGRNFRSVVLPVVEFPPGVSAQAWDPREERPVINGRAILQREGMTVASVPLDGNGEVTVELTERNLMPAGTYRLLLEADGYMPAEITVEVTDESTSYRIGRVELTAATKA